MENKAPTLPIRLTPIFPLSRLPVPVVKHPAKFLVLVAETMTGLPISYPDVNVMTKVPRQLPPVVNVPILVPITPLAINAVTLDPRVPIVRLVNNPNLDPAPLVSLLVDPRVAVMTELVLPRVLLTTSPVLLRVPVTSPRVLLPFPLMFLWQTPLASLRTPPLTPVGATTRPTP